MFFFDSAFANIMKLSDLKAMLLKNNTDISMAYDELGMAKNGLKSIKGALFPQLNLYGAASTGNNKNDTLNSYSSNSLEGDSNISGVDGDNSSIQNLDIGNNSWAGEVNLNYIAFARFNISAGINGRENAVIKSKLSLKNMEESQLINLYSLILEINSLKKIIKHLKWARTVVGEAWKIHNKSDDKDDAFFKLNHKYYELEYKYEQIMMAQSLSHETFFDLIPTAHRSLVYRLPNIIIEWGPCCLIHLKKNYLNKSRDIQKMNLDINTYKNYYQAMRWERPWIPSLAFSASYSKYGNFKGEENKGDYRASAMLSFNLFDGLSSTGRRGQAFHAFQLAEKRKNSESRKRIIHITKLFKDLKRYKAKLLFEKSKVQMKGNKVRQLKIVKGSGASVSLELSLAQIDYAIALMESEQTIKNRQTTLLNLAQITGNFDQVKVYEM